MRDEVLKGLTKEQIAKIKRCKDQSELLALAKAEGVELSEEQLEAVNGGMCLSTQTMPCQKCGSTSYTTEKIYDKGGTPIMEISSAINAAKNGLNLFFNSLVY